MGRQAEALAEIERARELDPLSLQINAVQGRILSLSNQNNKAIEQGRKALELDPGWAAGHWWLGLAYEQSRQYPEAIVEFQKAVSIMPPRAWAARQGADCGSGCAPWERAALRQAARSGNAGAHAARP